MLRVVCSRARGHGGGSVGCIALRCQLSKLPVAVNAPLPQLAACLVSPSALRFDAHRGFSSASSGSEAKPEDSTTSDEADTAKDSDKPSDSEESARASPAEVRLAARKMPSSGGDGKKLSKLQRGGLGSAGAALAIGGLGGLAWLNWPFIGLNGLCLIAASCGLPLLAMAAKGDVPAGGKKAKSPVAKRLLELKLLNDDFRLKGELDELKKIAEPKQWPKDVQKALTEADKAAKEESKQEAKIREATLLKEVQRELDDGKSSKLVRRQLQPRLFVFDFNPAGDGPAAARPGSTKSQLDLLRASVTFILTAATEFDEALLRLTSPGGAVAPYGLAASQLQRLRDAGIKLTICVDTVAASGGYMMACVGDQIVCAPFASVGSIGVIAGVPNVHKVLERNEVEFLQVTGGKYKRTVNMLTPNTEEGIAKFREDVDEIHKAFKEHVHQWRPTMDIDEIATGEVWLGKAAFDKGLVDSVGTSDDEIRRRVAEGFDAVELSQATKKKEGLAKLLQGLGGPGGASDVAEAAISRAGDAAKGIWQKVASGSWAVEVAEPRLEDPRARGRY